MRRYVFTGLADDTVALSSTCHFSACLLLKPVTPVTIVQSVFVHFLYPKHFFCFKTIPPPGRGGGGGNKRENPRETLRRMTYIPLWYNLPNPHALHTFR